MSISVNNNRITDLAAPTNANDAVNKAYVDANISHGFSIELIDQFTLGTGSFSGKVTITNAMGLCGLLFKLHVTNARRASNRYYIYNTDSDSLFYVGANVSNVDMFAVRMFSFAEPTSNTGLTVIQMGNGSSSSKTYSMIEESTLILGKEQSSTADAFSGTLYVYGIKAEV